MINSDFAFSAMTLLDSRVNEIFVSRFSDFYFFWVELSSVLPVMV